MRKKSQTRHREPKKAAGRTKEKPKTPIPIKEQKGEDLYYHKAGRNG